MITVLIGWTPRDPQLNPLSQPVIIIWIKERKGSKQVSLLSLLWSILQRVVIRSVKIKSCDWKQENFYLLWLWAWRESNASLDWNLLENRYKRDLNHAVLNSFKCFWSFPGWFLGIFVVSLCNRTAGRKGRQIACVWWTWQGQTSVGKRGKTRGDWGQ